MISLSLPLWLWVTLGFFCAVGVAAMLAAVVLVVLCWIDAPEVEGPWS